MSLGCLQRAVIEFASGATALYCLAPLQLWRSVRDFLEQSHMWTEEPILDDDGRVLLDVEAVQREVDDYAQKAYKAAKANKDVSTAAPLWLLAAQAKASRMVQRNSSPLRLPLHYAL